MTDTTLNRFLAQGTAAARAAFTPSVPSPASGPAQLYVWYETDTGDTYGYAGGVWHKLNTGGGGGGKVMYGQPPTFSGSVSYAAGYAVGMSCILPSGATIDRVGFLADSASASCNWRVSVYSDNGWVINAKQQESTLQAGVAKGKNIASLSSPYTNSSGSDQLIWLVVATDTAAFNACVNGTNATARLWNNSGSTLPSTAPAQSSDAHCWLFFGIGSPGT